MQREATTLRLVGFAESPRKQFCYYAAVRDETGLHWFAFLRASSLVLEQIMMFCYHRMLGCLVIVACLYAFGLALVLPRSVPRQLLGQRSLMQGSGNACSSARQSKSSKDDRSSLNSSKNSSPSLLMASMLGKVVPPKPAQFKKVSPKLQTAKLLPPKSPMSFLDQIKQKLSSDRKVVGAVSSGVQKVAKQNQKLVRRSINKINPTKTKAAASQLIQQTQRRVFLTKVGLTVAVLYVVWTFGVKELLRKWERKELKVWVDALDNLDYYEGITLSHSHYNCIYVYITILSFCIFVLSQ